MANSYDDTGFAEHLQGMDDASLLRRLLEIEKRPDEYRPGTYDSVRTEMSRRGLGEKERRAAAVEWLVEAALDYARDLRDQGKPGEEIRQAILARGCHDEVARLAARATATGRDLKAEATRNLLLGALWCTVAMAVVAIAQHTDWLGETRTAGAAGVLWGLILFMKGLAQYARSARRPRTSGSG